MWKMLAEWEHNIKMKNYECEAEDWFHLAQDMDRCRDGAETSGIVKCGNYLISRTLCFVELIHVRLRRYGTEALLMTKGWVIELSPGIEFP